MEHTDEETLTMMALGEETDPSAHLHLRECEACSLDFDTLRRAVTTLRTPSADGDLLTPPDDLWDSIATELRIPGETNPSPPSQQSVPVSAPIPMASRRVGRFAVALAACTALLGAAAGSALTWWVTHSASSTAPVVAEGKSLQSLRASSTGFASLTDRGGRRSLEITVKGLPRNSGYFEVWLMDNSHTKLVSMGVLGPDGRATLPVPDNIDLREYSVVDVSVQPYNGKPDHSGDSIVRGTYEG
ncbi:anti-sigma factor [Streptomyces sp. NPDC013740]|uniref:anti-sigma factor n=1 Tax=Streptomyces sp. NPDC013740 TaxID=3364867 RepID=UPI0036FE1D0A